MRTRSCFWLLLLVPFAVYGPAIFKTYGMRDDYSHIREAREEPGKLVRLDAAQGRPLIGALMETSFGRIRTVHDLMWLRFASVTLLAGLGLILWRQFDYGGWPEIDAAAAALAIILLPAAQITATWAVGWPWGLSLMLAVAGFAAVETEVERGGLKRWLGVVGGGCIYMLAALTYQPNALFAVVPIAAAALPRSSRRTPRDLVRWFVTHLAVLVAALVLTFVLVKFLFADPAYQQSGRLLLETNPFTKLLWFFWQPLPNALALYALRDDFHTGEVWFWLAALVSAGLIGWIARKEPAKEDGADRLKWWLCLGILPWMAAAVSLAAAERSTGYRTLWALSGLVVVMFFTALRRLPLGKKVEPWAHYGAIALMLLLGAVTAWHNTSVLIAEPQGREWRYIDDAIKRTTFKPGTTRIFVIEPRLNDRLTERMHVDEFGSLSTKSDWVPREMVKAAVYERFPEGMAKGQKIEIVQSLHPPTEADGPSDAVIDLRKMKEQLR
jgi:hypothetical protein